MCIRDREWTTLEAPVLTAEEIEFKRLRWRCRRGMRELDQLFGRYVDRAWAGASEAERGVFLQLSLIHIGYFRRAGQHG